MSGRWLIAFLAILGVSRVHMIGVVAYDPDEFEHLHAELMTAQGSVPYRDFFEHHGPFTYWIGAIPAKLIGSSTTLLDANRVMSLAFTALTCWAVFRLAERVAGKRSATWSLVWLLTLPWFADKSLEWRPDVLAMAFIALAAWMAAEKRVLLAGLFVGSATLCTQKSAALGLGIAVALIWNADDWRRVGLRFVIGALAPWLAAAAVFAALGGFDAFMWCLFYVPAVWPMKVSVGRELFAIALEHGPASLALGVAAWFAAWKTYKSAPQAHGTDSGGAGVGSVGWNIIRFPILLHWLAWPIVPAAYMQFHLLGLPLLAVAAARFLRPAIVRGRTKRIPIGVVAFLLLLPNTLWFFEQHFVIPQSAPVTRSTQLAAIHELGRLAPNTARVQDGFTGVGCLHTRADYWWWINDHSLALMERLGETTRFRTRLKANPPDVYIVDSTLRKALLPIEADVGRAFEQERRNDEMRYVILRRRN